MTVQELIDALEQVEDKFLDVEIYPNYGEPNLMLDGSDVRVETVMRWNHDLGQEIPVRLAYIY